MADEEKNAMDLLDDYQDSPIGNGDGKPESEHGSDNAGFNDDTPRAGGSDIHSISENSEDGFSDYPDDDDGPDNDDTPEKLGGGVEPKEGFDPTGLQELAPSAVELLDDPMIRRGGDRLMDGDQMEPPFDQAFSVLTTTGGPKLQMMSRMTPPLARAVDQAFNLVQNYKSRYISEHSDLYLRLNVSRDGAGRREIVESLNAGSGMSPEFYNMDQGRKQNVKQAFIDPEE